MNHALSRRAFLGAAGSLLAVNPLAAADVAAARKRVLLVEFHGGLSQLESWDPKPGTDTGGPFRAIQTSVPGTRISELLPYTAKLMHHFALVRGVDTQEDDHGKGQKLVMTGRKDEPGIEYPHIGGVVAKLLAGDERELPGHLVVTPGGAGFGKSDATFLGPRFASVSVADGQPPPHLARPQHLEAQADARREALRQRLNERFKRSRKSAQAEAYMQSYDQAAKFAAQADVFRADREPVALADRYGRHPFGRYCLLARRLLERDAAFVRIAHSNYDTHHENFDFHIEQLGEFDRSFATLVADLEDRGLLSTTLIVLASEFGRTPTINQTYGRDHWSRAWSVALGGCGIRGGAVHGKTNANGTEVTDGKVNAGHLFHTYLAALGLNGKKNFYPDERPVPIADPHAHPIQEVLA